MPDGRFAQQYLFYQPRNIERTVIDTRAGDDEVHADPGYQFPGTRVEWGIAPGDREQGALISALDDPRWRPATTACSAAPMTTSLDGGAGLDFILGGVGDDRITGGDGDDQLAGDGESSCAGRFHRPAARCLRIS